MENHMCSGQASSTDRYKRSVLNDSARPNLNLLEGAAFRATNDDPTFEALRTNARPLRSLAGNLDALGIKAWHVSLAGVAFTFASVVFMGTNRLAAVALALCGVFCDGMDGVVARLYPQPRPLGLKGDVIDTACDLTRVLCVLFGLAMAKIVPNDWLLWTNAACLISNSALNGWKNELVMGRVLSLYNQTVVVGGGILMLVFGAKIADSSAWKWSASISLAVLVPLLVHSAIIVTRLRRNRFRLM